MALALTLVTFAIVVGGLIAWFVSFGAPIRQLWMGLTSLARPAQHRHVRADMLAMGGGVAAISGAALAVGAAGPGALAWMWIGSALAMAWIHAEVICDTPHPGAVTVGNVLGSTAASLYALAVAGVGLTAGVALQLHEVGVAWSEFTHAPALPIGLALATLLAVLVLPRRATVWALVGLHKAAPLIIAVLVLGAAATLVAAPEIARDTLQEAVWSITDPAAVAGGLAGGVWLVAVQHGLFWTILTSGAGLGTASFSASHWAGKRTEPHTQHEGRPRERVAASAMIVPVLSSCIVATATALFLAAAGSSPRLEVATERVMLPMERKHQRGFRPSAKVGQLVLLPEDTPLQNDKHYRMVFRANPRGHKLGTLHAGENALLIPRWQVTAAVRTVAFRDSDSKRSENSGYDYRIEVTNEEVTNDSGQELVILRPVDPDIDLGQLSKKRSGPYVVIDDFEFVGTVGQIVGAQEGTPDYTAMYEIRQADDPKNPKLQRVIELGLRGPYFASDEAPRPWAFVATKGFDAAIGDVLTLEMKTPSRGLDIGERRKYGELRTPAWDFLADTEVAILRHNSDPGQDMRVPVEHRLAEDGTLRFTSSRPDIIDFSHAEAMRHFTGPYLAPPSYLFDVELHTGIAFPEEYETRRSLVALHPQIEAMGGNGSVYQPHPYEVAHTSMLGPFLHRPGMYQVMDAVRSEFDAPARLLVTVLLTALALASSCFWCRYIDALVAGRFGSRHSTWVRLAFPVAAMAGVALPLSTILHSAAWTTAAAACIAAVALSLSASAKKRSS
ncbi:MAG: hypothetical protein V3V08_04360 [Nannocystaceae bacterium]